MRYRRGDELLLKVEDDFGYDDITYSSVKVQVIGFNVDCSGDEAEYLCYVPSYEHVKGTWTLTQKHAVWYGVDEKFVGDDVMFIVSSYPVYKHMPAPEGERCDNCNDFFEGAVTDDKGRFTCSSCRFNPYR